MRAGGDVGREDEGSERPRRTGGAGELAPPGPEQSDRREGEGSDERGRGQPERREAGAPPRPEVGEEGRGGHEREADRARRGDRVEARRRSPGPATASTERERAHVAHELHDEDDGEEGRDDGVEELGRCRQVGQPLLALGGRAAGAHGGQR